MQTKIKAELHHFYLEMKKAAKKSNESQRAEINLDEAEFSDPDSIDEIP